MLWRDAGFATWKDCYRLGATITGALPAEGLDHDPVGMKDPEGNELDIN